MKIPLNPKGLIIFLTFLASTVFPQVGTAVDSNIPQSAEATQPLKVGQKIPDIKLVNADGLEVSLAQLVKQQPTIIIFYRGGWCVYCNKQFGQIKTVEKPLLELGYQIIAISPDRVERLRESLKKHNIQYMLLSDSPANAMKAFGVAFRLDDQTFKKYKNSYGIDIEKDSGQPHHLLPVPTAYVLDKNGVIQYRYTDPDYTKRVDPQELYRQAKAILEKK